MIKFEFIFASLLCLLKPLVSQCLIASNEALSVSPNHYNDVPCIFIHKLVEASNSSQQCSFVNENEACLPAAGYVFYVKHLYCAFQGSILRVLGYLLFTLWFAYLLLTLTTALDSIMIPNLQAIAKVLHFGESLMGETLIPLGNGAPDIFTAVVAGLALRGSDYSIIYGTFLGSAAFLSTIIVASLILIRPFHTMERPLLRAMIFYLAALYLSFYAIWDGVIQFGEAAAFLAIYLVYLSTVLLGGKINEAMTIIVASISKENARRQLARKIHRHSVHQGLEHHHQPFKITLNAVDEMGEDEAKEESSANCQDAAGLLPVSIEITMAPEAEPLPLQTDKLLNAEIDVDHQGIAILNELAAKNTSQPKDTQNIKRRRTSSLVTDDNGHSTIAVKSASNSSLREILKQSSRNRDDSHHDEQHLSSKRKTHRPFMIKNPSISSQLTYTAKLMIQHQLSLSESKRSHTSLFPRQESKTSSVRQDIEEEDDNDYIFDSDSDSSFDEDLEDDFIRMKFTKRSPSVQSEQAAAVELAVIRATSIAPSSASSSYHPEASHHQPSFQKQPTLNDRPIWRWICDGICPLPLEDWVSLSVFARIVAVIKIPILFSLKLTSPAVIADRPNQNWNRPLNSIHCLVSTVLIVVMVDKIHHIMVGGVFPLIIIVAFIGIVLASAVFFTSSNVEPPRYHAAFAFLGFFSSVMWIYMLANEVINIIFCFGVALNLSQSILATTCLAWGNSLADLVNDITLAKQGFSKMALTAVYSSLLFNKLIGLGLTLTIVSARNNFAAPANIPPLLHFMFAFVGFVMASSFVAIPLIQNFHVRRPFAIYLIILYILCVAVLILQEANVINLPIDGLL